MKFAIDIASKEPIYKQLVALVEKALRDGSLQAGEQIPSMNELAAQLNISKETVKKAYGILVERRLIIPKQGKGFYAADLKISPRPQVLVIFDKLSVYKQALFHSFSTILEGKAEVTIVNHNQSVDLLEYYLDNYLDNFDFYVVTPHFPLDESTQAHARKQIARIPNRKLIMLDRLLPDYPGNYGAVFQDFENDIHDGLTQGIGMNRHVQALRVITLPSSLYGEQIQRGIIRFCKEQKLPVEFLTSAPEKISTGDTFLLLNSQLNDGLVALARKIQTAGLTLGRDVLLISYNEADFYELVLGGLTTVSADFSEMGRLAAQMILERKMGKIHCPFRMNRRSTF